MVICYGWRSSCNTVVKRFCYLRRQLSPTSENPALLILFSQVQRVVIKKPTKLGLLLVTQIQRHAILCPI